MKYTTKYTIATDISEESLESQCVIQALTHGMNGQAKTKNIVLFIHSTPSSGNTAGKNTAIRPKTLLLYKEPIVQGTTTDINVWNIEVLCPFVNSIPLNGNEAHNTYIRSGPHDIKVGPKRTSSYSDGPIRPVLTVFFRTYVSMLYESPNTLTKDGHIENKTENALK